MSRFVTIVATVEVPDGDITDAMLAKAFQIVLDDMAEHRGIQTVGCDWEPDLDTVADGIAEDGSAYGRMSLIDLNPSRSEVAEGTRA